MREKWSSRSAFILAAIGSAVGLGNAWRFPGLASKYGGGAFLFVYLIAMLIIGIPLLMMEVSVARYTRLGAPGSMRALNKKTEAIGWLAVSNGIGISIYYAAVFAWVILMFVISYKFGGLTGDSEAASKLWMETIRTTGTTSGFTTIAWPVVGCLIAAWILCYLCIRNGTTTVGKVVKFTVSLPVLCLLVMAIRGVMMPGAMAGLSMGGGHTTSATILFPNTFDYICPMSCGIGESDHLDADLQGIKKAGYKLYWIGCGEADFAMPGTKVLDAALTRNGMDHVLFTSDGGHEWKNWRLYLQTFAKLLFK